jgi:hypothetical protein
MNPLPVPAYLWDIETQKIFAANEIGEIWSLPRKSSQRNVQSTWAQS